MEPRRLFEGCRARSGAAGDDWRLRLTGAGAWYSDSVPAMPPKTSQALRSARGVSGGQARAAAEKPTATALRARRIENKLNVLVALGASVLVGVGLMVVRLFVFD